jgi:hypothetical protein
VLLEKLIIAQLVKKIPAFYASKRSLLHESIKFILISAQTQQLYEQLQIWQTAKTRKLIVEEK